MPQISNSWRRWVEPWYLTYALQGAIIAGLLPILLPLAVSHAGNAANIGLMMAGLSLGGLSAPLWGSLADRYRLPAGCWSEVCSLPLQVWLSSP